MYISHLFFRKVALFLALTAAVCSCGPVMSSMTQSSSTSASISTTDTPTLFPYTSITPTVIPGAFPVWTPNPNQQVFTDPDGWYSVNFPADWKSTDNPNSFSGKDGFFETGTLPEMGFVTHYLNVCVWFANIEMDSDQSAVMFDVPYGGQPRIWSCNVTTKASTGNNVAVKIFENPGADYAHRFVYTIHGNNYSGPTYSFSISWLKPFVETRPSFESIPLSSEEKAFWDSTIAMSPEIVVNEYLLPPEAQKEDAWRNYQLYNFVPPEIIPTRKESGTNVSHEKPSINEQLKPLGYELVTIETGQGQRQQLYRDGRILFDHVYRVSDVYEFSTETEPITAFIVETRPTIGTGYLNRFLIQNDIIYQWSYNNNDPSFAPILYEGELLWVRAAENAHVLVQKSNQQVVFNFATYYGTHLPVNNFKGWDNHWILEVGDFLTQDGEILNEKFGFPEVYNWRLINEKPFYFFRKGQRVGISYNEQFLSLYYHDVLHGLCCGYAGNNPRATEDTISFFGQRDGVWYYVVIEFN